MLQLTVRPTTILCSLVSSILNLFVKQFIKVYSFFKSYQTKIYEKPKFKRKRNCTSFDISFSVTISSIGSGTVQKPAVYRRVLRVYKINNYTTHAYIKKLINNKNTDVCFSGFMWLILFFVCECFNYYFN